MIYLSFSHEFWFQLSTILRKLFSNARCFWWNWSNQIHFFYVIKRLINVVVVFNNNIFVFVIVFHVCTSFECSHFHFVYVVVETFNDLIVQNDVVSNLDNKIIIKIIFHCIYCDKNYYDKNHCEIFHFEFKKKNV